MRVLITGATGNLGRELVRLLSLEGHYIKVLARDTAKANSLFPDLDILEGDVTLPYLGLSFDPEVDALYHLAALVDLGDKNERKIYQVNVGGTSNAVDLAARYRIDRFVCLSTAYTAGRNPYEKSKCIAEILVQHSDIKSIALIKPSIIVGSPEHPGAPQTVSQVALSLARVHRKAERARRTVQAKMALPPLELAIRMKGDPESTLNLIPVDIVADAIVHQVADREGTFCITNPRPPRVQEVADAIGEVLSLNFRILKDFRPSLVEKTLYRLVKSFLPYLHDEPSFKSILHPAYHLPNGYMVKTLRAFFNNQKDF